MGKRTVFDIKIDFEKSHGSYLVDKNSQREFLDFFGMFSSLPLGYNHKIFDKSFKKKIENISKIRMANNLFQSDELYEFENIFRKYIFSDYTHYTCTGALAVEAAIKCAMEYKKVKNPMVLALDKGFHGINSWGFVTDRHSSVTERMRHFPKNSWKNLSIEEVKQHIKNNDSGNIVAVVIEAIQCTAGDIYFTPQELLELQQLCKKNDICFIVDEIQTGFGVTGTMWYSTKIGIEPDVLVFGKKSQICGIVAREKYNECMVGPYRKLEVTFDGELIDAVRAAYVLKAYEKYDLLDRANSNSKLFAEALKDKVLNYRSSGHLIAFDFETPSERDKFVKDCYDKKLLCNPTAEKTVRMRPNMAVSMREISHFREIIDSVL
ncbi:MAG: aminotransferase class III-fold pyridoxal phosphate-dependent enzyme [Candidatus Omnitrophica bacterium]|nr:aminotransferase class III-fold pyridoxal phosphate-dependent enzyme [Candidatus Omnitrophota bacterium]MDD5430363.1 aminotransferase class III-fold pyridoxal phosphate-dependent enzyme [Candidatus Omnitrophota bacterium]